MDSIVTDLLFGQRHFCAARHAVNRLCRGIGQIEFSRLSINHRDDDSALAGNSQKIVFLDGGEIPDGDKPLFFDGKAGCQILWQ